MGSQVIEVVERRRRWPVEEKLKILDEVLRPGASVADVADRHGVARALIYQWMRKVREGRMSGLSLKAEAAAIFAPVKVEPAAPAPRADAAPCAVVARPPVSTRKRPTIIEIALGNGRVVKVDEGVDPAALAAIIAALDTPEAT
jgi:transposase